MTDIPKTQRERMLAAVEAAYNEQVGVMFKTLVANMIEAKSRGGVVVESDALGMFARGKKIGWDSYQAAIAAVDKMAGIA